MQADEDKRVSFGTVQVDNAHCRGIRKGGKHECGAGQQAFVAAVSIGQSVPMRAKFTVVTSFKQQDLAQRAKKHIAKKAYIMGNGMVGFYVLEKLGYRHTSMKTTQNPHAQYIIFRWVNAILKPLNALSMAPTIPFASAFQ